MDVDKVFAAEMVEYGKGMVDFVVAAGLGQMAAEKLAQAEDKAAVMLLLSSFNKLATMLIVAKGWSQERLGDCEHAMLARAAADSPPKIVVADATGRVH